mmetsp:Transcript_52594/g.140152  ORF Transcript_52594/g.140152 Transcript_52594/m.140152 type:complete len:247 (-) Transcript_52594:491-1231(-)
MFYESDSEHFTTSDLDCRSISLSDYLDGNMRQSSSTSGSVSSLHSGSSEYSVPSFNPGDGGIIGVDEEETVESRSDSSGDGDLDDCRPLPAPPVLPSVPEELLQDVWPLGEQSFSIFVCPITHDVMVDPVVCADGHTYERSAIARWLATSRKSPVTGHSLPHTELIPNHSVRTLLQTLIDLSGRRGQRAAQPVVSARITRTPPFLAQVRETQRREFMSRHRGLSDQWLNLGHPVVDIPRRGRYIRL